VTEGEEGAAQASGCGRVRMLVLLLVVEHQSSVEALVGGRVHGQGPATPHRRRHWLLLLR
jgi:hypothetical protein